MSEQTTPLAEVIAQIRAAEALATEGPWSSREGDLEGGTLNDYIATLLRNRQDDGTSTGRLFLALAPNTVDPERGADVVTAMTGDGPAAEANAHLIALLRTHAETLLEAAARTADLTRELAEARAERHVVHVTSEPVAEDVVWCEDCEEWVTSGASEHPCTAEAALAGLVAAMEGLAEHSARCAVAALKERWEGLPGRIAPTIALSEVAQELRAALAADHGPALAARDAGIRDAERADWSSWIDKWLSAVGPKSPTVEQIASALRVGPRPFGIARADRIEADQ